MICRWISPSANRLTEISPDSTPRQTQTSLARGGFALPLNTLIRSHCIARTGFGAVIDPYMIAVGTGRNDELLLHSPGRIHAHRRCRAAVSDTTVFRLVTTAGKP